MMQDTSPKFQISKFLGKGRDYQVVIRTQTAAELVAAMEEIKPLIEGIEKKTAQAVPQEVAQKSTDNWCDIHQVGMKLNKNGKPYHMDRDRDESDQFCNGYGFKGDKKTRTYVPAPKQEVVEDEVPSDLPF